MEATAHYLHNVQHTKTDVPCFHHLISTNQKICVTLLVRRPIEIKDEVEESIFMIRRIHFYDQHFAYAPLHAPSSDEVIYSVYDSVSFPVFILTHRGKMYQIQELLSFKTHSPLLFGKLSYHDAKKTHRLCDSHHCQRKFNWIFHFIM